METGTVSWFNRGKGYGFITTEDGVDVFFHHSAINMQSTSQHPVEGDQARFSTIEGIRGPSAENVRLI